MGASTLVCEGPYFWQQSKRHNLVECGPHTSTVDHNVFATSIDRSAHRLRLSVSICPTMAWGGNVRIAHLASQHRRLEEGDDECMICCGGVPASIGLLPCKHSVCISCMEAMRARNVLKVRVFVCFVAYRFVNKYMDRSSLFRPTRASVVHSVEQLSRDTSPWESKKSASNVRRLRSDLNNNLNDRSSDRPLQS